MSKQSLLLVDGDTRSMRVLEVSLRKVGFTVTTAVSVQDALDKLELDAPDLIISETTFPDGDGFDLRRRVRGVAEWAEIPFIFLTAEAAIENKIRGLELGVDDYLTKPIYIKEIVTRINILLQKRQRARFEERRDGRTRFAGRVADMPVVDVIQTIEISRKSGVIQFVGERGRTAAIYFRDGRVIDAEAGTLQGEDAVYRLLTWNEGEFEVVFRTVRRREVIETSSQGLLMEGMRRLDEWSRLLEQLPPLGHRFEIDTAELALRIGEVPDEHNAILRLFDGKRTLLQVIDASDVGDLECLQVIARLYFEELLVDLDHGAPTRDSKRGIPLIEYDAMTPFEEVASGPVRTPPPDDAPPPAEPAAAPDDDDDDEAELQVIHEEELPTGPLMGGFRPSSLRLIDEAVAAAEAIEPSLLDEPAGASAAVPSPVPEDAAHDSVPQVIEHDEPSAARRRATSNGASRPTPERARTAGEDAGLRMIGSAGRDRAETSGEVTLGATQPRQETQRELVTIMPRRTSREIPSVVAMVEPEGSAVAPVEAPELSLEVRRDPTAQVRAIAPAKGARMVLVIAGALALVAIYLYATRSSRGAAVARDAGRGEVRDATSPGAPDPAPEPAGDGSAIPAGHRAATVPHRDGGTAPAPDRATHSSHAPSGDGSADRATHSSHAPSGDGSAAPDPRLQAIGLYKAAKAALAENEHARALELADQSLRLRRSVDSYVLRARALQRLDRIDDALAALDDAERLARPHGGRATVYEWRARILRAARRLDEARPPMEEYLRRVPTGDTAAEFRRWLGEP